MTQKRRIAQQLPLVYQTSTLNKFFSGTVDHLFEPGKPEIVSGYIGKVTTYSDSKKDFYIRESNGLRQAHQLVPIMVSTDENKALSHALFYDDFVSYLRANGSIIDNEARLFETEAYSWSAPVDLDKLTNPLQYYWFPLRKDIPTLTLSSPLKTYVADGSTTIFDGPEEIENFGNTTYSVYFGNGRVSPNNYHVVGNAIFFNNPPRKNEVVLIVAYGNLLEILRDTDVDTDISPFNDKGVSRLTSTMQIRIVDENGIFTAFENYQIEESLIDPSYDETWTKSGGENRFDLFDDNYYSVEMTVDGTFEFVPVNNFQYCDPQYRTISRLSKDANPWSVRNNWVHVDSFAWSNKIFPNFQAKRPIIEFIPGLSLHRYGSVRLDAVKRIWTSLPKVNGLVIESPLELDGKAIDSINFDARLTSASTRIFVNVPNNNSEWNVKIYKIDINSDSSGKRIIAISETSDILNDSVFAHLNELDNVVGEYYFVEGAVYNAQTVTSRGPLFKLFDFDGVSIDDEIRYPSSNFSGSTVFDYKSGVSPIDSVLGVKLSYNTNGNIEFDSTLTSVRYHSSKGEINGLYFYLRDEAGKKIVGNNWHRVNQRLNQTKTDGYFDIPLSLAANAANNDISTISKNDWYNHFSQIMSAQDNFSGEAFSYNNWRDTAKDLSKGRKIIQTDAPLLKSMLFASDNRFDLILSIKYVEQEYNRFKLKLIQKAREYIQNNDTSERSVEEIAVSLLQSLSFYKTAEFPFSNSTNFNSSYYIPATPASIGITQSHRPALERDGNGQVTFIVGHDGSRLASFGDYRDDVLLYVETQIYEAIPEKFKLLSRPDFDLHKYDSNPFYEAVASTYTRSEMNRIISPLFEHWVQQNRLDYRTNETFDPTDAFSFNYRGMEDTMGNLLPGNWMGIYEWYYDTIRPHTHPWEMFGFAEMPEWFTSEYGAAPYTSSNTKLWDDVATGTIRQGDRKGVNLRYSRPSIQKFIPVDNAGNLLDPISAGIVARSPTYQNAARSWAFGDGGPVESIWRRSSSFPFAKCILSFLIKPALFVETNWNTLDTFRAINGQRLNSITGSRSGNEYVHGEVLDGKVVKTYGIQQWISDYMISKVQNPSELGRAVRNLDTRLSYKMAGFTDKSELKVVADNFGIIPQEDISVQIYNSPSTREENYSGIIVETTGKGWRVVGYNPINPYFVINDLDEYGPKKKVRLSNDINPVIHEWKPNVYYSVNTLVSNGNSIYRCSKSHTSSLKFEKEFWSAAPDVISKRAPEVNRYLKSTGSISQVPYGAEFSTVQDLADFMFGYEAYLTSRGWVFEETTFVDSFKSFLEWAQVQWEDGNFIALSPFAEKAKFVSEFGTILDTENQSLNVYGLIDRSGYPIPPKDTIIERYEGEITLETKNSSIFGSRVRVGEIEHILVFNNKTIFEDMIYDPIFNVAQPRLKIIGKKTKDWTGRLDSPGFVILGDTVVSNFEKQSEDIRYAFDIEQSDDKDMRDMARSLIGYTPKPYLNSLLLSETEQFEFYQGYIQEKGTPIVFNKLLRSEEIDRARNLKFIEEWAFHYGTFGSTNNVKKFSVQLDATDVRRSPFLVEFAPQGAPVSKDVSIKTLPLDSSRWISKPAQYNSAFVSNSLVSDPVNELPTPGNVRVQDVDHILFYKSDIPAYYNELLRKGEDLYTGNTVWHYTSDNNKWDVLRTYDLTTFAEQPNNPDFITRNRVIETKSNIDDPTVVGTRLYMEFPHGLTAADIGLFVIIDSTVFSNNDITGAWELAAVNIADNWIEINEGLDEPGHIMDEKEMAAVGAVRILRPMRFAAFLDLYKVHKPIDGMRAYIDDCGHDGKHVWGVYVRQGSSWVLERVEPKRIDGRFIKKGIIYDLETKVTKSELYSQPLIIDGMDVLDPSNGLISGVAEREISFKTEYDPAYYTSRDYGTVNADRAWGPEHVGDLWWDVSKVRYIDPYSNDVSFGQTGYYEEINYRANNWAKIAPKSTIQLLEWVRSTFSPSQIDDNFSFQVAAGAPLPYLGNLTPFTLRKEYDAASLKVVDVYYFWSLPKTSIPASNPKRQISSQIVYNLLATPTSQDSPWVAAIADNVMLIGGSDQYLIDGRTVLQVEVNHSRYEGISHTEWELVRENDPRTNPSQHLWETLFDNVAGIKTTGEPIKSPLYDFYIGSTSSNGLFNSVAEASIVRKSTIADINEMLGLLNLSVSNADSLRMINEDHSLDKYLMWNEGFESVQRNPPHGHYDHVVYSIKDRNDLLSNEDFLTKIYNGFNQSILVDGRNNSFAQWVIWTTKNLFEEIAEAGDYNTFKSFIKNSDPDDIFVIGETFHREVDSYDDMLKLSGLYRGEKILVGRNSSAGWVIYSYVSPNNFSIVSKKAILLSEIIKISDWYEAGEMPQNAPKIVYNNYSERNNAEGVNPISKFVMIQDNGYGHWVWERYDDYGWRVVAEEDSAISLVEIDNSADSAQAFRVILDIIRNNILTTEQANRLFFSIVRSIHAIQDRVDWAFKTSFLSLTGYNEPLTKTPLKIVDNTNSLIEFTEEVKPYHVKIRDVERSFVPDIDNANVQAIDFDRQTYVDPTTGQYTRDGDGAGFWEEWEKNYNSNNSPVRQINTKIVFDRISPNASEDNNLWEEFRWEAQGIDTNDTDPVYSAADRISDFYKPTIGMKPKNIRTLLKLDLLKTIMGGPFNDYRDQTIIPPEVVDPIENEFPDEPEFPIITPSPVEDLGLDNFAWEVYSYENAKYSAPNSSGTIIETTVPDDNGIHFTWERFGFDTYAWSYHAIPLVEYDIITPRPIYLAGAVTIDITKDVSEFDVAGFEGWAFDTILPKNEKSIVSSIKGDADKQINSVKKGLNIRDPYNNPDSPEELVSIHSDDAFTMRLTSFGTVGSPRQVVRNYLLDSASNLTFNVDQDVPLKSNIFVFADGRRTRDFTFNSESNSIGISSAHEVSIHSFSKGSTNGIIDQQSFVSNGQTSIKFNTNVEDHGIRFIVDGVERTVTHTKNERTVSFNAFSIGSNVTIIVYYGESDYDNVGFEDAPLESFTAIGTDTSIEVEDHLLSFNSSKKWALDIPKGVQKPYSETIFVEKDGYRLTPCNSFRIDPNVNRTIAIPSRSDVSKIVIRYSDITETAVKIVDPNDRSDIPKIPIGKTDFGFDNFRWDYNGLEAEQALETISVSYDWETFPYESKGLDGVGEIVVPVGTTPPDDNAVPQGNFYYDGAAVYLSDDFQYRGIVNVLVIDTGDFYIDEDDLHITADINSTNEIAYSFIKNSEAMGMSTTYFKGNSSGIYYIDKPYAEDYTICSVNGRYLTLTKEYGVSQDGDRYYVKVVVGQKTSDSVVITTFSSKPSDKEENWIVSSVVPSSERFVTIEGKFSAVNGASKINQTNLLGDAFEKIVLDKRTMASLDKNLEATDRSITINTPFPDEFTVTNGVPKFVWIGGEKISYYSSSVVNGKVVLSELVRNIHGSRLGHENRSVKEIVVDGRSSYSLGKFDVSPSIEARNIITKARYTNQNDYTLSATNGELFVSFSPDIGVGTKIIVAMSFGDYVASGTSVISGNTLVDYLE